MHVSNRITTIIRILSKNNSQVFLPIDSFTNEIDYCHLQGVFSITFKTKKKICQNQHCIVIDIVCHI